MTTTLDNCEREPIHIPGSIQPHGVLFACRGDVVVQVSANVVQYFGVPADGVIGAPLTRLLSPASAALLARAFAEPDQLREVDPVRIVATGGATFDAVLHVAPCGKLIVEVEPVDAANSVAFNPALHASMIRLQRAKDLGSLYAIAADEVRAVTGFDRVMIYRFDRDWNGEVLAEARRDDLEPFLGLHYPASDIPAQARRLYTINWLRFIGDVAYAPVPVIPALPEPLDMSFAMLRSVSPVHIEYLRNMGVTASMSVSLVIDGILIGLISCHHYSGPRLVPYVARETAEYLGRLLSWNIATLEKVQHAERARRSALRENALVRTITEAHDFLDGMSSPAVLELAEATGAAVVLADGTRRIGDCPPAEAVAALIDWLAIHGHDVFASSHAAVDVGVPLGEHAGVLAVAISRALREYIVWFRRSSEYEVDWAGDPRKTVVPEEAGAPPRLSPRGSFALWRETVRGHSQPWDALTVEAASNLRRTLLSGVRVRASELNAYNQRLLESDRTKDDFIATVSHELRTPLNSITGWAQLLAESPQLSPERLRHGLEVIQRNARAQIQIIEDLLDVSRISSGKLSLDLACVDLHEVVVSSIDSVEVGMTAKDLRLKRILDPAAALVLGDATRLRQIVSNLLTNAIKFTPKGGAIIVTLRRLGSELELAVQDSGQGITPEFLPLVFDVFRQADSGLNRRSAGLGLGLAIARRLVELHGGRIAAESDGAGRGATFRIWIPIANVKLAAATPPGGMASISRPLVGFDILVVEDDDDSRDLLAQILAEAGARCTTSAGAGEALGELARRAFTVLISDIGMPGQDGLEFMRAVRIRPPEAGGGTPAIALTAHTRVADRAAALDAGYDAHVGKPVDASELLAVVRNVVARVRR